MKILKVWYFWQEEIKYHDHYLAEEMSRLGIETTFLAPDKADRPLLPFLKQKLFVPGTTVLEHYRVVRVRSFEFAGKNVPMDLRSIWKLLNEDFDVIHIFGISNVITFLVLLFARLKRKRAVVVINDHNHPSDHIDSTVAKVYHGLFRHLFWWFKPVIDRVIVPNKPSWDYLRARYRITDDSTLKIIPLGFNQRVFRLGAGERNKEPGLVIGFAGKLYPQKRVEALIEALASFDAGDVRLVIAGMNADHPSEYQSRLLKLAAESRHRNIEFRPFIDTPKALAEFYAYIDLAVFPGGISITTLEASGCGTPVVIHRATDGLEDRVDHGRGVLFDTDADLVAAIEAYLRKKRSSSIDHADIARQSLRHCWAEITRQYLQEYAAHGALLPAAAALPVEHS